MLCGLFIGSLIAVALIVAIYVTTLDRKPLTNIQRIKFGTEKSEPNPIPSEANSLPPENDGFKNILQNFLRLEKQETSNPNKVEETRNDLKTSTTKTVDPQHADTDQFDITDLVGNVKDLLPLVNVNSTMQKIQNYSVNVLAGKVKKLMVPGTKWCGRGSVAASIGDLGAAREADLCCREHDGCTDIIEVGETKHGLTNKGFFALSACSCEDKLMKCLKKVDSFVADIIGFGYFTLFRIQCFKEDYPIVGCNKWQYTSFVYKKRDIKRCAEYDLDLKGTKKYQFFDTAFYC
ncbi:hypothetical protein Zmor_015706 [Zophobas morio]|uniref:Phospholipase A2 n=1 Tax=Zophobas morio TaxID=2755281 RepID=A0AA38MHW1_9CUCU|nr:hypothetical protein Zmor_015706 [Zophobas morio]